jgi:hypothetical protein
LGRIELGRQFTENVSNRDVKPAPGEICLLSFDGETISHICLARSSKMNVTARMTLKFSQFTNLGAVKLSELEQIPELRSFVGQLFSRTVKRIEGANWSALLTALKQLRPAQMPAIDELEKNRLLVGKQSQRTAVDTIAQERDATRLALECFGLDKDEIKNSLEFELPLEPAPYLIGVKAVKLREDPMIDHDACSLPDFSEMRPYVQGSIEFTKGNERITVLNVNRAGVERAVGVDLIYYTHTFKAYVMVQYKRLHKVPSDWEFNLNESQFLADLERMDSFEANNPPPQFSGEPVNYRLNSQHFYFKFCKNVSYEPLDSSMIEGMYLPKDYLQCLMKSSLVEGGRGGRVIGFENVQRHFNNTHFIGLVRGSWIGSRANTTDVITKLVRGSIDADRSVIVGISSTEAESVSSHF